MENGIAILMVVGFFLLVIVFPAIVGAIARLIWKSSNRITLASSIAILLITLNYLIKPHQFEMMIKPMKDNEFPPMVMYTMTTFLIFTQVVLIAYVTNLGIRFVDKKKKAPNKPLEATR